MSNTFKLAVDPLGRPIQFRDYECRVRMPRWRRDELLVLPYPRDGHHYEMAKAGDWQTLAIYLHDPDPVRAMEDQTLADAKRGCTVYGLPRYPTDQPHEHAVIPLPKGIMARPLFYVDAELRGHDPMGDAYDLGRWAKDFAGGKIPRGDTRTPHRLHMLEGIGFGPQAEPQIALDRIEEHYLRAIRGLPPEVTKALAVEASLAFVYGWAFGIGLSADAISPDAPIDLSLLMKLFQTGDLFAHFGVGKTSSGTKLV